MRPPLLDPSAVVVANPSVEALIADALAQQDGVLAANGALVCRSGSFTGRTPKDKFVVRGPESDGKVDWSRNQELSPEAFARVRDRAARYSAGRRVYQIDTFAGADLSERIAVRFLVERPYHALFIRQLLIRPTAEELAAYRPDWHAVDFGRCPADPSDGVRSEAAIALNFDDREVVILGTEYAGEMKKSVFTILNYLLPLREVLSMHCSANVGEDGHVALFFGLSGTGKTTLSADAGRALVGDDEHGWNDRGVFNFEGGCYAKCIGLRQEREPQIWDAIRHGAVLENVVLNDAGVPDYEDGSITENTRAAYPLDHVEGARLPSVAGHPRDIVFLTCDALGVLPPIARLDPRQAMDQFLNGYTAKVAGTEAGVTEPTLTFSACFGAPFLPLDPHVYARLLGERIDRHGARVWLVNTGWTGGPFGEGHRIALAQTREIVRAALSGKLDSVPYRTDPIFGLACPTECPGVPADLLDPRRTWADPHAYDRKALELRGRFEANLAMLSTQVL